MTQLTIVAHTFARPNRIGLVKAELERMVAITRVEEGCIRYDLHQDNANPAHFVLYETWESRQSWLDHMGAAHLVAYRQVTDGSIADFTLSEMNRIA